MDIPGPCDIIPILDLDLKSTYETFHATTEGVISFIIADLLGAASKEWTRAFQVDGYRMMRAVADTVVFMSDNTEARCLEMSVPYKVLRQLCRLQIHIHACA